MMLWAYWLTMGKVSRPPVLPMEDFSHGESGGSQHCVELADHTPVKGSP